MNPLTSEASRANGFPNGLTDTEASERLRVDGFNEFNTDQRRTLPRIVAEILREPMFLLLLGAGTIYLIMGDAHEALVLLGFVVVIMAVTVLQERRTENALKALRDLSCPRALVIRDGTPRRISGREVVQDDILVLTEGDRVPADGELFQAHELCIDESMLTGESEAVAKFADSSRAFAGTLVVGGQGVMRVTATGARTELGRIGKSLQEAESVSSPLRHEIGDLTRRLAVVGIGLCLLLVAAYQMLRGGWLDSLLAGITLAMGILPQEFPVILIVFLALGARRMAQHRVLTRRIDAIETLGETTVLCVDKTGTLTENRMAIAALSVGTDILETTQLKSELPECYHLLLEYAVLASEVSPHDPMEQAFHRFAHEYLANTEHLHPEWALVREYELSSELLAMSHLWRNDSGMHDVVAAKGAPEAIADLCHLGETEKKALLDQVVRMAERGMRVLAVAKAKHAMSAAWPAIQHAFDFEYVGLVGLADPLRPEVPSAVAECQRAGIRVIMITGDHPHTARAIAARAGLDTTKVLTGKECAALDAGSLACQSKDISVFARVSPHQKLAIVEALKLNGEVVAMTGDGVNDAPALKAAHIGIAMGKRGTDVAREAAALVLLDDNFNAIVAAIRSGRRIYANLRQAFIYTLAIHVPIIGLSLLPLFFGLPLMLAPIHIAFLELVIDPVCSIVFEAEPEHPDLMKQPPRSALEHLVSAASVRLSLIQGALASCAVAGIYSWWLSQGSQAEEARALAFVMLIATNVALILSCRKPQSGLLASLAGMPRVGLGIIVAILCGTLMVIFVPFLASLFAFSGPGLAAVGGALGLGLGMLFIFEFAKMALGSRNSPTTPI